MLDHDFTVLGIDPGMTSGVAWVRYHADNPIGKVWEFITPTEVREKEFNKWLQRESKLVDAVACEDFTIKPYVQKWKNTVTTAGTTTTSKIIGRVEMMCFLRNIPLEMFQPHEKKLGYEMCGMGHMYDPTKKNMHRWDALAHARSYFRRVYSL